MVLRPKIDLVGTFFQSLIGIQDSPDEEGQCGHASTLTRNIRGSWKLKYSCLVACVSVTALRYTSEAWDTRARMSSSCRKICKTRESVLSKEWQQLRYTLPGFLPLSKSPPFATAFPIARLLPPDTLPCMVFSLNDSPSFCNKTRSSSSELISSRFLLFSVTISDSCRVRSYRMASSLVWWQSLMGGDGISQIMVLACFRFLSTSLARDANSSLISFSRREKRILFSAITSWIRMLDCQALTNDLWGWSVLFCE